MKRTNTPPSAIAVARAFNRARVTLDHQGRPRTSLCQNYAVSSDKLQRAIRDYRRRVQAAGFVANLCVLLDKAESCVRIEVDISFEPQYLGHGMTAVMPDAVVLLLDQSGDEVWPEDPNIEDPSIWLRDNVQYDFLEEEDISYVFSREEIKSMLTHHDCLTFLMNRLPANAREVAA